MKEYKDYKITLLGAGGGGKTTLMNDWAEFSGTNIVQAQTKSFMPENCKTHRDLIRLAATNPEESRDFQEKIIKHRYKLFSEQTEGFVSDRSVMDSVAYYAIHNSVFENSAEYDDYILAHGYNSIMKHVDITFQLAPDMNKMKTVEDNGTRITSTLFFKVLSEVMKGLLGAIISQNNFTSSVLTVDDKTKVLVMYNHATCIARLNESDWENGIAPREVRVKAIAKLIDFLNLVNR